MKYEKNPRIYTQKGTIVFCRACGKSKQNRITRAVNVRITDNVSHFYCINFSSYVRVNTLYLEKREGGGFILYANNNDHITRDDNKQAADTENRRKLCIYEYYYGNDA